MHALSGLRRVTYRSPVRKIQKLVYFLKEEKRAEKMVDDDLERLWDAKDLCKSDDAVFAASGVCDGYLPGVIFEEDQIQTFSELIDVKSGNVSRYDKVHPL